jgi:hypothetical protein
MWTLVIFIYAGALARGDSVALDHVHGFKSEAHCAAAGSALKPLVSGTAKEIKYVCFRTE